MGVNSPFVNMTWENPILFYCEIKLIIVIIVSAVTKYKWRGGKAAPSLTVKIESKKAAIFMVTGTCHYM